MFELFANSGNPDQAPHSVASDLGLHCLPITLLGVFRLQWVKIKFILHVFLFTVDMKTILNSQIVKIPDGGK